MISIELYQDKNLKHALLRYCAQQIRSRYDWRKFRDGLLKLRLSVQNLIPPKFKSNFTIELCSRQGQMDHFDETLVLASF